MGALWSATPTKSDKIYVYTLFAILLFFYPGICGFDQYEELSAVSLAAGAILYASALSAIAVISAENTRKKRTIGQSTDFRERVGISSVAGAPVITGLRGRIAWVLWSGNLAIWAVIGFLSLVFGPPYLLECSLTSVECRLSPSALDLNGSPSSSGFHVAANVPRPGERENGSVAADDRVTSASPDRQAEPLASAATGTRGTLEVEETGSNSYRLHLTGADFDSAAAGRTLLTPKAAELCGSEPYRFGHSLYSWKRSMARGGELEPPVAELTQDVHCGRSEAAAAETRRIGLADLPEKAVIAASEEYFSLRESARYADAYEFFDASRNSVPLFAEWQERVSGFHAMAGALDYRRVRTIDWYGTAPDDIYVALDFVGRYANAIAHCAHLVWHWQPGHAFVLVSEEELYEHRERERLFEDHCAEGTW